MTALIFFANSAESRALWSQFFSRCFNRYGWCCYYYRTSAAGEITRLTTVTDTDIDMNDFESDDAYYGRTTEVPSISGVRTDGNMELHDLSATNGVCDI
jgi:hypothetical protein